MSKTNNVKQGRKASLTHAQIVESALAILAEQDIEAVSFRRLAQALDVSPMALYRYYDNKNDLLAAMLDRFIEQADVLPQDDSELSWQDWLRAVAEKMYQALVSTSSWLPYLGQLPLQSSGLSVLDACLGKLQQAGFTQEQAARAFFSLLQVLFGAAVADQQLKQSVSVLSGVLDSSDQYPNILHGSEVMAQVLESSQIELGMDTLIAGLQSQLL